MLTSCHRSGLLISLLTSISDYVGFAKSEELEACVRERERAVRKWGVGREFADGLGRVQRGLAEQLSAVQGVLATKLDRVRDTHLILRDLEGSVCLLTISRVLAISILLQV